MSAHRPVNLLLVDDSAVVRKIFRNALEQVEGITILDEASDGIAAIKALEKHGAAIDIITLDINMPNMDGLTALPELLKINRRARVLMVSASSKQGSRDTIRALSKGAADYIPKPEAGQSMEAFSALLVEKIRVIAESLPARPVAPAAPLPQTSQPAGQPAVEKPAPAPVKDGAAFSLSKHTFTTPPKALAIGASTGGPDALSRVFTALSGAKITIPIFVTQHMPKHFTAALAEQIGKISAIPCHEADEGMVVTPGHIYLARGDFHMLPKRHRDGNVVLTLSDSEPENFCRPAVDPMLRALGEVYGGQVLTVILTGMGADGAKGAEILHEKQGVVLAQDKKTSVVWGMPGAAAAKNICSAIVPLEKMTETIKQHSLGTIA